MNYIHFSFIAAFFFAISQILNKLLSKHNIDNKDSMMAYFMLATASFALVLIPFVSLSLPPVEVFKYFIFAVFFFVFGFYFFFTGIFDADASSFAPLFQVQAGLIAVLAFVFLGERFTTSNYWFIFLLIIGAVLVSIDESMSFKKFFTKGIGFILLMQVFHATSNIFVGFSFKYMGSLEFLFWENLLIGLLALIFIFIKKPKMNYGLKKIYPMFLSSYATGFGVVFLFKAFTENLTVSSAIGLLSAPIVFVFSLFASKFFPKLLEHHSSKVYLIRGFGLLIILAGAYGLS